MRKKSLNLHSIHCFDFEEIKIKVTANINFNVRIPSIFANNLNYQINIPNIRMHQNYAKQISRSAFSYQSRVSLQL